nr:MAG TPA: hypothetical protein [Caudoviricetes sp.]
MTNIAGIRARIAILHTQNFQKLQILSSDVIRHK